MNRCALFTSVVLATALAGGYVHAQKTAPGLWEHTITPTGGGEMAAAMAQMQRELAKMPPEQRKQMEQMMGQHGIGMTAGGGTSVRVCITPEQAARDEMPQQDGRCSQQSMQRSGNVVRFKFACSGDPPTSGEGEATFTSDKAYTGRMTLSTVAKGKTEQMQMAQTGRWLSADCGKVAPAKR